MIDFDFALTRTPQKDIDMMLEISKWFKDSKQALDILKSRYTGKGFLKLGDGRIQKLEVFYSLNKGAHRKRLTFNTPHVITILIDQLSYGRNDGCSGLFGGHADSPASLDYYDNKIDQEGHYALKYGVFKHD